MKDLDVDIIRQAFIKAYRCKDNGKFTKNNSLRSAKFVFELGKELKSLVEGDCKFKVQEVNDNGKKKPGEWLFDIAIVRENYVVDEKYKDHKVSFNDEIEWVVESEYHTSLTEFSKDFSKLLSVKAYNALYLNGLNQKEEKDIEDYIKRRKRTVQDILEKSKVFKASDNMNLYLGFWPTPQKVKRNGRRKSQWDFYNDPNQLINRIQLYKYLQNGKFNY